MASASVSESGYRRMITALGIAQICSWGSIFYSFPLIAEAMRMELGWSKPLLYGGATAGLILAALAAYPVGAAIDRGQGRWVMSGASLMAGLLYLLWSQVDSIALFYVVVPLLGGLQAATLYEPAFAVLARRVGALEARRAITALTLWGGFASTVFVPLVQWLIDMLDWRGALMVLGAINAFLCASLYVAVIDPTKDRPKEPARETGTPELAGRAAVFWAFRQPVFWALVLFLVLYAGVFSSLSFHLYPLLLERGLSAGEVVSIVAVIGPAQVAGRIAIWTFAPEAPVRRIGAIMVGVFPLVLIGYAFAPPQMFVVAAIAAFYGAANGMMTIVRGLAVPEMLSREAYGAINGALITPSRMVEAVAPLGVAALWAASGGYDLYLMLAFAATLVMVGAFWTASFMARPKFPKTA
ncbi:MFS transporter [Nitratireductor rhodophyticola]|uniref:MFS transporter n=1 Tax=Nitratireductor rhodophyticola TaxID=2854036 RepID=UPI002AC913A2|nr:MFS transporter [Nitratireductor rhodophyticola]WPZ14493.1 MFS transporter [Nitratireductor rhodophyticola]